MEEQGFYSRSDKSAIDALSNMFSREGVFVMKHEETRLWYKGLFEYVEQWTDKSFEAMTFKTQGEAMTYRVRLGIRNTIIVERINGKGA